MRSKHGQRRDGAFEFDGPRGMHGHGGRWGGRHGGARGPFGGEGSGFRGDPMGGGFGAGGFGGGGGRGRGGPGGGRGMGGGRRRRVLDQGELQVLILSLLIEAPRHGYDLIREIEALTGGEYAPSPGVVYPALTYMEESGLIAIATDEGARKSYEATPEGRARAQEDAEKAEGLRKRLAALADARERTDPAPVRRAIQALRTAVFDRLSQENASREHVLQIADALDEATRKIERIEV
ncbi:PadR family transcriptional regulator [Novosphingobium profundi]|uniref:PadR family transcriptional regulator n=1 Tax=Novosphingobium profundi TaxID=1774954 RepID=UPI001BD9685F|nr:PadR family transcriptional regulator [Novosphingobium profundi]MBT0669699.1 PadR family transcriptional regulator [Novosphingobium profundi]